LAVGAVVVRGVRVLALGVGGVIVVATLAVVVIVATVVRLSRLRGLQRCNYNEAVAVGILVRCESVLAA